VQVPGATFSCEPGGKQSAGALGRPAPRRPAGTWTGPGARPRSAAPAASRLLQHRHQAVSTPTPCYKRTSCLQRPAPPHFHIVQRPRGSPACRCSALVATAAATQRASTSRHAWQAASGFPAHALRRTYARAERSLWLLLQPRAPRRLILHRTGPSPGTAPKAVAGHGTPGGAMLRGVVPSMLPHTAGSLCRTLLQHTLPCKSRQRAPGCRPRRGSH